MKPLTAILWAALPLAAGSGLYLLKMEVESQEQRLASLHREIAGAEESIHVLRAEWSYLNDPTRLREEAERHLALHPVHASQIVTIASLPMADPSPDPAALPPLAKAPVAMPRAVASAQPAPAIPAKRLRQ